MKNEGKLQTCIAIMAALAIMMLGTSQDSTTLPAVGLLVAFASLIFTDLLGWFSLHPYVAGAAGIVAGVNAFVQSQAGGLDSQFIAVANLLIHLQIILLFQKKSRRINWQLITLSLLQVVVAAALNLFVLFGPLLVMYTCIAIVAMLLFFQRRQLETFTDPSSQASSNFDNSVSVLAMQPVAANAEVTSRKPKRRSSLGTTAFFWHFFQLGASTIVVSAAVFLLMPRFGNDVWRAKSKSVTGLSDQDVNLDTVSSIYEDPTIVMRVSFFREGTNEPYTLSSYPYLRATVRDIYRRGKWRRSDEEELDAQAMSELKTPTRVTSAVRQKVILESASGATVCAVAPPCGLHDVTDSMRICPRTLEVKHFVQSNEDSLEFSIGTLGYRNGLQSEYLPAYDFNEKWHADRGRDVVERQPELAAKAAEIVKDIPEDQVLDRVRALELHFRDGRAGYKYSLDPSPDRDPRRWPDPVEDFVLGHNTGHCQFFASALALMLRSQGIPARYVSGFRADSYNVVGGYYQLRAMDAHAWVEAKIPADQVPSDEIMPTEGLGGAAGDGAWVRLDPTPSGDLAALSVAVSPWRQKFDDSMDYMQLLWSEYVLGLNEKRQRKAIYEPILNALKNSYALAFSREIWAARMEAIRQRFEGDFFTRENMRDAGLAIVVLTIAFYVLRFLSRWLWSWFSSSWGKSKRDRRPRVEFYRRFEKILAKHGIQRESGQTPSEFATLAEKQIAERTDDESLAKIPRQVVDLFYRVRFGDARLDSTDLQRLENCLGSLQNSIL